jgi:hypothetical protein
MRILELIESGELSVDQGLHLLDNADEAGEITKQPGPLEAEASVDSGIFPAESAVEAPEMILDSESVKSELLEAQNIDDASEPIQSEWTGTSEPAVMPSAAAAWRRWWMIPLWVGVGLTVVGGLLMAQAQQDSGIGIWFFLAGVPLVLGLLLIVMSWESRTWPWLYLRVRQAPNEWPGQITFSFPIPVQPAAWILRHFGRHIPNMGPDSIDQVLQAIGDATSPENPIFIEVEDDEGGERVEIYIG